MEVEWIGLQTSQKPNEAKPNAKDELRSQSCGKLWLRIQKVFTEKVFFSIIFKRKWLFTGLICVQQKYKLIHSFYCCKLIVKNL